MGKAPFPLAIALAVLAAALVLAVPAAPATADSESSITGDEFLKLADSGNTITLTYDITVSTSIVIPAESEYTIDLNGYALVGTAASQFIVNNGTLTIDGTDSSLLYTTNVGAQGRAAVVNYGTLVINGGTFGDSNTDRTDANSVQRGNAVRNYGTATINGGYFTCCDNYTNGGYAYPIANGSSDYPDAVMTINSAYVYGSVNGLLASDGGTLTVNDGTFTLGDGTETNLFHVVYTSGSGTVVLNGGSYTRNVANTYAFFTAGGSSGSESIFVNGGTFYDYRSSETGLVGGDGYVVITCGTFNKSFAGDLVKVPAYCTATTTESGWVVTANTTGVASIGDRYYTTLADAIEDAADGETVKLESDVTECITIPSSANITLDLNGFTLTNSGDDHTITNDGTLIVTDSVGTGTVDNTYHQKAALLNNGTATLNGGTFTRSQEAGTSHSDSGGNSYYTIENTGTMYINEGVTVNQGSEGNGNYSSLICNVGASSTVTAELTIAGGTFSGGLNLVKNDQYGILEVTGGTFTCYSKSCIMNWNIATINGGTFTAVEGDEFLALLINGKYEEGSNGTLSVLGGSFTGSIIITSHPSQKADGQVEILGGEFEGTITDDLTASVLVIQGGVFSEDPDTYVTEPYAVEKASIGYRVVIAPPTVTIEGTTVTIEVPDNTTVLYTTDGSDPATSETAVEYGASFTIGSGTTVKAVTKYGSLYSAVISATSSSAGTVITVTETTEETIGGTEVEVTTVTTAVDDTIIAIESSTRYVTSSSVLTSGTVLVDVTIATADDVDTSVLIAERMAADAGSRFSATTVVVTVTIETTGTRGATLSLDSTETLKTLGATLTVVSDRGAQVTFDSDAVSEMDDKGTGVTVIVRPSIGSDLTDDQMSAIGSDNAYTLQVISDGLAYSDLGGYATVSIAVSDSSLRVYHVAEDGTKTLVDSTYSDGYVTFRTLHFSVYVLSADSSDDTVVIIPDDNRTVVTPTTSASSSSDDSKKVVACAAAAVAAAMMAALVFSLYRRK